VPRGRAEALRDSRSGDGGRLNALRVQQRSPGRRFFDCHFDFIGKIAFICGDHDKLLVTVVPERLNPISERGS
jgi:hypothetical protein